MSVPSEPTPPLEYVHAPPVTPIAPPPQFSPEHLQQLQAAKRAMRKIRRAATTALFDGWTVASFGILTFLFDFTTASSVLLGVGLALLGGFEIYNAGRLKKLDETALPRLAWNQLALGGLLFIYASWRMYVSSHQPSITASLGEEGAELEAAGFGHVLDSARLIMIAVYGCLMAVAVFGQGSMVLYYLTRRKHLKAYLAETQPWITQMQRAGVGI